MNVRDDRTGTPEQNCLISKTPTDEESVSPLKGEKALLFVQVRLLQPKQMRAEAGRLRCPKRDNIIARQIRYPDVIGNSNGRERNEHTAS
jgi:hypothetical protein